MIDALRPCVENLSRVVELAVVFKPMHSHFKTVANEFISQFFRRIISFRDKIERGTKSEFRFQFKQLPRYNSTESWTATAKYLDIAEKHGLTLAEMSLAFVTQQPFVSSNIIGATSMVQLKENIGSATIHLSDEILKEINGVHKEISNPAP